MCIFLSSLNLHIKFWKKAKKCLRELLNNIALGLEQKGLVTIYWCGMLIIY